MFLNFRVARSGDEREAAVPLGRAECHIIEYTIDIKTKSTTTERIPTVEQPIRDELQELKRRIARLERYTEPIQITKLEVESGGIYRRLDEIQDSANTAKIQVEGVRADIGIVKATQSDLREYIEDQFKSVEQKQDAHQDLIGQMINVGEEHTKRFDRIEENMATKDDIKNMATKDDIKNMATKDDIKNMATKDDIKNMATKDDIKNMATKDDIKNMATKDDIKNMATRDDIKNMATRDDLSAMEARLLEAIQRIIRRPEA